MSITKMTDQGINLSPIKWFGLIITIIALTNITVLLGIPVLRQIFAFIFLTFIPGFLLVYILKLNRLGLLEKIVLSVGLSVAFSMFFGLAVSSSLLAIGYTRPLSTIPLLFSFSLAAVILAILAYMRNKDTTFPFPNLKLTLKEKTFLILPFFFPLLSIIGMHLMNLTDNNLILMVLLFLIPAYIIFISLYRSKVPERLYPSLIYLISISLILMLSLRSNHLIGADVHDMYYLFQQTSYEGHWGLFSRGVMDACLSISLLPTIYQSILNIDPEYLFKILYSLLCSISPLVVYIICKKYIGSFYALLASFFLMSQVVFLVTPGSATTCLAILFFALAIMVLFHRDISELSKRLFFIIFAISCIMSHYSTSYIFFFILLLTWIGMQIIPRIPLYKAPAPSENSTATSNPHDLGQGASEASAIEVPQSQLKLGISTTLVILFFVLLFLWYSQITEDPFHIGVRFIYKTLENLQHFYLLESRGGTITAALGERVFHEEIPQKIRFVFSWLTIAFIAIGVLTTIVRYKRMVSIPSSGHIKPSFLRSKMEIEYVVLSLTCSAILTLSVVLPFVQKAYSMERTYFQMMAVLSPFFVIGGIMVAKWLRAKPYWIVLVVLIPYFMCTTGTMYQISGIPGGITLNSEGKEYDMMYVHDQETYAARWIKEYGEKGVKIYSGGASRERLTSQGQIPVSQINVFPFLKEQPDKDIDGYIYLRYFNVVDGKIIAPGKVIKDIAEYSDRFAGKNKIYDNGGSEVYR